MCHWHIPCLFWPFGCSVPCEILYSLTSARVVINVFKTVRFEGFFFLPNPVDMQRVRSTSYSFLCGIYPHNRSGQMVHSKLSENNLWFKLCLSGGGPGWLENSTHPVTYREMIPVALDLKLVASQVGSKTILMVGVQIVHRRSSGSHAWGPSFRTVVHNYTSDRLNRIHLLSDKVCLS